MGIRLTTRRRSVLVFALLAGLTGVLSLPAAATAESHEFEVVQTQLTASDVAYDALRDLLWVTVLSADARYPNQLVAVRPADGAVVDSLFVGSEPLTLALAPDASTAYVGLAGANQLIRVSLDPLRIADRTTLTPETDRDRAVFAEDIVVPGDPDVAVVSLRYVGLSPRHAGAVVVDADGVRPVRTSSHTGPNVLTTGPDARTIYGYNNETTSYELYTMEVRDDGLHRTHTDRSLITGPYLRIVHDAGRIYASSGRVVDPTSGTIAGSYPAAGAVLPDGDLVRVWSPGRLETFDRARFTRLRVQPAPEPAGLTLVSAGDVLAGVTGEARLVLFHSTGTRPAPAPGPDPGEDGPGGNQPGDPNPASTRFSDLRGGPHDANIVLVAGSDIAGGYPDGTYRPEASVSRAQMASFLARAFSLPAGGEPPADAVGSPHAAAIASIIRAQIATGYGDGTYRPNEPVTREQMATFLTRALTLSRADGAPFADVSGPHAESVGSVYAAGIADGTGPATYHPRRDVTRAQMATFLARALELTDRLPR